MADTPHAPSVTPPRGAVRIYLKHHTRPELNPEESSCQTDTEKHRVGCGQRIIFFKTYPKEKRMPFDGPPHVVEGTEVSMGDGGFVAWVIPDNVHFATCTALVREKQAPADGRDFKQAAGGDR